MEAVLSVDEVLEQVSFWRSPARWFRSQQLGSGFWTFFWAAFFFDAGFAVYFFLFNLYLVDLGMGERAIGLINGAVTFGSVCGTLPAGLLARRFGVRPVMLTCFVAAPIAGVLRVLWMQLPAQLALAFLGGLAMCLWGICFLPVVSGLTTEGNRASAFSLIFSVSIGTGALGSMLCGYLPRLLHAMGMAQQPAEIKRGILIAASVLAFAGLAFALRVPAAANRSADGGMSGWWRSFRRNVLIRRLIPLMALWSAVIAAFTSFGSVYLARGLHLPLARIAIVFAASQIVQLIAGLMTAPLFRAVGLRKGVAATQVAVAVLLTLLASVRQADAATLLFLGISAAQWMSSPGLYNLLMSGTPEEDRGAVAALAMFCNALVTTVATMLAGAGFASLGYPLMFFILACAATLAGSVMLRLRASQAEGVA
ncbi:Major Facilitator Superfamily transporter [Terriglobus roseus DSM 18391]|uniref:Major Facilitator Superfamily transporter n=2 Tax=Terriglobus roseus TaxID=392734 RepID=I3ZE31_TERRK|nr:Major Facilitator Superfamily transporter [Terriglobus roseus DSM 18391]